MAKAKIVRVADAESVVDEHLKQLADKERHELFVQITNVLEDKSSKDPDSDVSMALMVIRDWAEDQRAFLLDKADELAQNGLLMASEARRNQMVGYDELIEVLSDVAEHQEWEDSWDFGPIDDDE